MNPGEAPEEKPAPGLQKLHNLQAAGFGGQDLAEWKATQSQSLTKAGFTPSELVAYWGDGSGVSKSGEALGARNMGRFAGRGEVAHNTWEQVQAGFGTTAVGLGISGHMPDYVLPKDAGLGAKIASGIGQFAGDAPVATGAFLVGLVGGTAAAVETGPAAPFIGLASGGALGNSAPVAARETLMTAYRMDQIKTKREFLSSVASSAYATAKAALVGAVAAPLGGAVGGKVLAAGATPFVAGTADAATNVLGSTAMAGALDGKMPDKDDMVTAAVLAFGTHAAVSVAGRARPTEGGRVASHTIDQTYRQTGIMPKDQASMAQNKPEFKQEMAQQDVNGEPVIPNFRQNAPPEPPPYEPKGGTTPTVPSVIKPSGMHRAATVAEASAFLVQLEGSAGYAKQHGISEADVVSPAGAIGRYQIMPGTAKQYGFDPARLHEAAYNEQVHTAIVQDLLKRYNGDMEAVATAYNAGPGRANKLISQGPGTRLDTTDGKTYVKVSTDRNESFLPYETQKYLANLRRHGGGGAGGEGGGGGPPGEGGAVAFGRREQVPAVIEPETVQGERTDWGAKSTEERYAAASAIIGEDKQPSFWDYANPNRIIDQFVSELQPAREFDTGVFSEHPELNRNRIVGLEDAMRNTYASDDRSTLFIQDGAVDGSTNRFLPGTASLRGAAKQAVKDGGNLKDWQNFLLAARTMEKADQGIKTGMDPELAKAIVNDAKEQAKYKKATAMFQQVGQGVIRYAVEKGRYSQEQAERMVNANLMWVSMRRVQGDDEAFTPTSTIGKFKVGRGIRKMEGSDRQIVNPMIASIDNWRMIVADADRNEAAGVLVSAVEGGLAPKGLGIKHVGVIGPGKLSDSKALAPYAAPDKVAELTQALAPDVAVKVFKQTGKPNQFLYFRDGKAEVWETSDPNLARLMRGAESPGEANVVVAAMQAVASLQRAGIVSMPDFAVKNVLTDQVGAFINSPLHPPPFLALALGMKHAFFRDQVYKDWAAQGGAGSSMTAIDRNYLSRDMRAVFDETGAAAKVWNHLKHPLEVAQIIQERMDAAQRIGFQKWAKFMKVDERKAAIMSRETYIDFKEKGTLQMMGTLAKIDTFLRPTVLGLKQTGQAIVRRPIETAAAIAMFGTVVAGLHVLNSWADDDLPENRKFKNMERWKKDMYLNTPEINGVRFKLGTRDLTMVANATINRYMDFMFEHDRHAYDHFGADLMKLILPSLTPAAAKPIGEATFNYSEFTGHALIPASLENASGPMQYTPNTSEVAKSIAKFLGPGQSVPLHLNSPVVIDNFIRGYAGSGGIAVAKALDAPDAGTAKPKELADNPFVEGFVHRTTGAGAQPIQDFYDAYDKVKAAKADVSLAKKRHDHDEMHEARSNRLAGVKAETVAQALNRMSGHIQAINSNERMTVDEKRQYTEALYSRMIVVSRRGLQIIDRTEDRQKAREATGQAIAATTVAAPAPEAAQQAPVTPPVAPNAGMVPVS